MQSGLVRGPKLSLAALLASVASGALAQSAPTGAPQQAPTAAAMPSRASARVAAPAAEDNSAAIDGPDEEDIVVRGSRALPGSVVGDIPPEEQLSPADIRFYGVNSVADLLSELAPETRSGRGSGGAPVVLLNGKRISGFQEIRDLPTEAIQRVDILPEEVALKYGYRADQRVVNFVLRRRFRAVTAEVADRFATAGGRNSPDVEANLLRIRGDNRLTVHLEYQSADALTEAERGITGQLGNFAIGGNVVSATPAAEIDPALSTLAGSTVTIAGVPASAATTPPTLADFAATANRLNTTDQGRYRTLLSSSRDFTANIVYARPVGNVQATINGQIELTDGHGLNGLPTVALGLAPGNPYSPFTQPVLVDRALFDGFAPLAQRTSGLTAHVGTTLNGDIGKWRWTFTGTFDRAENETITDTGIDAGAFQAQLNANDPAANPYAPFGPGQLGIAAPNRGRSVSTSGGIDFVANGKLFALPAGDVSTSIRIGGQINDFSSETVRGGVAANADLGRNIGNGQLNIDLPLASKGKGVLGAIGDLSANFNVAGDYLSDFGTLTTIGYGFNWQPIKGVRLIGSATDRDTAPSQQQLGNPAILTPNVRIYDYVRGTTATVTTLTGGNPGLIAASSHVKKLGLTLNPFDKTDFTFIANYVTEHIDNPVVTFPSPTAAIEAAYPTRFMRDNGQLVQIDQRPINFASSDRSELRWGFTVSKRLKSKLQKQIEAYRAGTGPNPFEGLSFPGRRRDGQDGADGGAGRRTGEGAGARQGGGFRGGGGGFGGRGAGQAGGRLQFAVYHTWHFTDSVLVAPGGPKFDLLSGDAVGGSGGQPRHEVEVQAGYSNNGLGARLSANWKSGTDVFGGTPTSPQTLHFSDIGTVNLRLFADLGARLDLVKKHPWMRGARVVLSVDNLFDQRQTVTDQTGTTPLSYQPGYVDPLGRTIRITLRKLFF